MTIQQVIKKAQQKYPIGSLVYGLNNMTEKIISQEPLFVGVNEIWFEGESHNIKLYNGKEWAVKKEVTFEIY